MKFTVPRFWSRPPKPSSAWTTAWRSWSSVGVTSAWPPTWATWPLETRWRGLSPKRRWPRWPPTKPRMKPRSGGVSRLWPFCRWRRRCRDCPCRAYRTSGSSVSRGLGCGSPSWTWSTRVGAREPSWRSPPRCKCCCPSINGPSEGSPLCPCFISGY